MSTLTNSNTGRFNDLLTKVKGLESSAFFKEKTEDRTIVKDRAGDFADLCMNCQVPNGCDDKHYLCGLRAEKLQDSTGVPLKKPHSEFEVNRRAKYYQEVYGVDILATVQVDESEIKNAKAS